MNTLKTIKNVTSRFATEEGDGFWKRREEMHEHEIQNIKERLRKYHGGVFDSYLGLGADKANKLRQELEKNRVAWFAARDHRNPTRLSESSRNEPGSPVMPT